MNVHNAINMSSTIGCGSDHPSTHLPGVRRSRSPVPCLESPPEEGTTMADAIPRVNVQALAAFFTHHFESMRNNTQPKYKNKNKEKSRCPSSSKRDKSSESSLVPRSISVFDLSKTSSFTKCQNVQPIKKRFEDLGVSLPNIASLSDSKLCKSAKCTQVRNLLKKQDSGYVDSVSNDSGIEGSCDSSTSGDSNSSTLKKLNRNSNHFGIENIPKSPTVNIVIKPPLFKKNKSSQNKQFDENQSKMIIWNRTYEVDLNQEIEQDLENENAPKKTFYSEVIINNNYICKAQYQRTKLPSLETLGPPPEKPEKSFKFSLPCRTSNKSNVVIEEKPVKKANKPSRSPPPPPFTEVNNIQSKLNAIITKMVFAQDKNSNQNFKETDKDKQSLWYKRIYNESSQNCNNEMKEEITQSYPPTLPPRKITLSDISLSDISLEELYQDTQVNDEKIYEEVQFSHYESQLYNKGNKSNRVQKEITKLLQKEQRERERRERELDKGKRRFGLTGDEIPLDNGYVKSDTRGGRGDLAVRKGETVLIIRMEDNPIGRWLVQNEKGKIGYVELDNITMDANSVKSVMKERRLSMGSKDGRNCSVSSGEAIYEEAC